MVASLCASLPIAASCGDGHTEALALSHRIAVMNAGRVEQLDEPSRIYSFPRTRFVADFIGHCNLLSGPITANGEGIVTVDVAGLGPVRVAASSAGVYLPPLQSR